MSEKHNEDLRENKRKSDGVEKINTTSDFGLCVRSLRRNSEPRAFKTAYAKHTSRIDAGVKIKSECRL